MTEGDIPSTEIRDFKDVLSTPVNGELPLVVGGHAVHLWALAFESRLGGELKRWFPLVSKDLDLYGTQELLEGLKQEFGGHYRLSGPRSPVIGQLVVQLGGFERKIDVLRDVMGLSRKDLAGEQMELDFEVDGQWQRCRVPPLLALLRAKISNLASLDQTDRNDGKHVEILIRTLREYLAELIEAVHMGILEPRGAIVPLEEALAATTSKEAQRCLQKFGTDFSLVWPRDLLAGTSDERIGKFVRNRLPAC